MCVCVCRIDRITTNRCVRNTYYVYSHFSLLFLLSNPLFFDFKTFDVYSGKKRIREEKNYEMVYALLFTSHRKIPARNSSSMRIVRISIYTYSSSMKVYVYYTCIGMVQQCGRASPCAALFVCLGTQKNSIRLVILRCLVGVFARSFIEIMTDAKSDQCTETLPSQTMNEYTNTHTPYASP